MKWQIRSQFFVASGFVKKVQSVKYAKMTLCQNCHWILQTFDSSFCQILDVVEWSSERWESNDRFEFWCCANFSWRNDVRCLAWVYVQYITWAVVMMMMGRIWVEMMDDHGPPRVRRKPLRRKKQPQASLCQNRERWGVHLQQLDPRFHPQQHGSLTSRWKSWWQLKLMMILE